MYIYSEHNLSQRRKCGLEALLQSLFTVYNYEIMQGKVMFWAVLHTSLPQQSALCMLREHDQTGTCRELAVTKIHSIMERVY